MAIIWEKLANVYRTTRLLSNLKLTTHECVHLVTRIHVLTSGHMTKIVVPPFTPLCFTELELLLTKVLHCRNRHFLPFLLLWHWPWPDDQKHIRTWPIFPRYRPNIQIWTSYIMAFESYHLTDRQTNTTKIIYHAALWMVKNSNVTCWKILPLLNIYSKWKTDLVMILRCRSHRPNPVGYIGQTAGPPSQNVHAGYIMSQYSIGYITITHILACNPTSAS